MIGELISARDILVPPEKTEKELSSPTQSRGIARFGPFELDLQTGTLMRDGRYERLPMQPARLLLVLVNSRGKLVTREELRVQLWPEDTFVDFDHGLNNAVNRIREVLRDSAASPRYIQTVPRRGYRFIGELEEEEAAAPQEMVEASVLKPSPQLPELETRGRLIFRPKWSAAILAIALCILITIVGLKWRAQRPVLPNPPPITSLAVLPLKNLSGDPAQEYLADGMTEAVIGRLSMIHGLRVISRTSVMHFKDTQLSVPEIARTLHVDAIVEGSVIREGSHVRINAQLIRGSTDEHFWSEAYDRELGDALTLESDVAQSISRKVEVTVTGEEHARLVAARPVSPEVYESYLRGRFANGNNRADMEKRVAYFEDSIRKDATFAPAYVGLAAAYQELGTIFVGVPPGEVRPKVISAARKALELDPELAEAHTLLASMYMRQWHWAEAEVEYRRAVELNPNDAVAHLGLSDWMLCQGRTEEALAWARRGRELDPLGNSGTNLAWTLFNARRYDDAIHELRGVLAVRTHDAYTLWYLGLVLISNGQAEEAIPVLEKAVSISNRSPGVIGVLVRAYAQVGRRNDALRLLGELKRRQQTGYVPAGAFVNAYLGLGDSDQVFIWLQRAYEEQSNILIYLKVLPFFDPLRDDQRFKSLVHRVGLDRQYP
jgi:TolB-like protein/DNA-binding winged helix-turn-helix (wHTH) protein/Flp pilus assembly protein TadD